MDAALTIDPRSIPAEGRRLTGTLPSGLFDLPESDPIRPAGGVEYTLHALRDDNDLIVTGRLRVPFTLECVRCLSPVDYVVELKDYSAEIPIENDQIINLTDWIREDILLALPSYPRCEDGNVLPRECSAEGDFEPGSADPADQAPTESASGAWDVLDQLK